MAMSERGRALYEEMKAARGFIYPAYELLCEVDPELLENYENLKNHIMKKQGPVSREVQGALHRGGERLAQPLRYRGHQEPPEKSLTARRDGRGGDRSPGVHAPSLRNDGARGRMHAA